MTLPLIIYRSLRQHALSTIVTAGSIALACGLWMSVWVVKEQAQAAFTSSHGGFDAVLGARGSKLQLVLNAVFHLEASPGNLEWADFDEIRRHPVVKAALPIAVGDNLHGYRLVGTLPEVWSAVEYAPGRTFAVQPGGRVFATGVTEAVVGDFAARQLGLRVGDTFHPFHGLAFDEEHAHAENYVVVGILKPTNTPADRVIWVPLEGVQRMSGHDPQAATQLSAVLLQLRAPTAGFLLDTLYNKRGQRLTFAYPVGTIMAELFQKLAWFDRVLQFVAYLVALVAAGSVLASIYNSMSARRRDLAILRALGARRRLIFGAVVCEAGGIGLVGSLLGLGCHFALVAGAASLIRAQTGVVLDVWSWSPVFVVVPAAMVALCALGGVGPALKAYGTPVAETLTPVS